MFSGIKRIVAWAGEVVVATVRTSGRPAVAEVWATRAWASAAAAVTAGQEVGAGAVEAPEEAEVAEEDRRVEHHHRIPVTTITIITIITPQPAQDTTGTNCRGGAPNYVTPIITGITHTIAPIIGAWTWAKRFQVRIFFHFHYSIFSIIQSEYFVN